MVGNRFGQCEYGSRFVRWILPLSILAVLPVLCAPAALLAQSSPSLPATALPTGGTVVAGSGAANIGTSGNTMTINQTTANAVINWSSFNIGSSATVNFNQPNSSSVTVNRATGSSSSTIDGALNANGNIFLLNANGILIDSSAKINVGGFVASTLDVPDTASFGSGSNSFTQGSTASSSTVPSVVNMGTIQTNRDGGYVALLGATVSNQGTINAGNEGTVALAAGNQIVLNFNGNSLVGVTVSSGVLNELVENKGAIYADGGKVILTAGAADDLLSAQVSNDGTIQAQTVSDLLGNTYTGSISLISSGTVSLGASSVMDASGAAADAGGTITTSGTGVSVANGAQIKTNSTTTTDSSSNWSGWTIDTAGFTVGSSGNISGAELGKALNNGNVQVISAAQQSNGATADVSILDPVSWSGGTLLKLQSSDYVTVGKSVTASGNNAALELDSGMDIDIDAPIVLSGNNASMTMNPGLTGDYYIQTPATYAGAILDDNGIPEANKDTSGGGYGSITLSGQNPSLTISGNSYTLIQSMSDLSNVSSNGYYALAENLDGSGITYTSAPIPNFYGVLAGLGHTINNLTIDAPTTDDVGLIGYAQGATVRDLGLTNANITGHDYVGALLGEGDTFYWSTGTLVENAYSTGSVTGDTAVGGLVGSMDGNGNWGANSVINHSFSSANVTATNNLGSGEAGGLAGEADAVENSDATGTVTVPLGVAGGLIGTDDYGVIGSGDTPVNVTNSYATGKVSVTAQSTAGGLIGMDYANVYNSFATGDVSGQMIVGGLIGETGGIAGNVYIPVLTVQNSWASGNVYSSGNSSVTSDSALTSAGYGDVGGLIGASDGTTIIDSFATGKVTSVVNVPPGDYTDSYSDTVGGLVGTLSGGSISGSYATGNVTTITNSNSTATGGLVGEIYDASITSSYATGNVSGATDVGGLVGSLTNGGESGYDQYGNLISVSASITNSTAYGNVSGTSNVGGIVGQVSGSTYWMGDNSNAYATVSNVTYQGSSVTGTGSNVGGIAGSATENSIVQDAVSTGDVSGASNVGGVLGYTDNTSTVSGSISYGLTMTDATMATMTTQEGVAAEVPASITVNNLNTEDNAQASGDLGGQVSDSILVDFPSSYSATLKTVVVDGVEYQIQVDDNSNGNNSNDDKKKKSK